MSRQATCPRCQAPILRGYDSDWCGIPITLDTTRLDALGETLALATNRHTYDVRTTRDAHTIARTFTERTPHRIRTTNWNMQPRIHAEHRCHQPLPADQSPPFDWNQEPQW